MEIKGYKVFNPDWTCRDKQYTCPGEFEENITPYPCNRGMHFCKNAVDCFNYYDFKPDNKVAEVIAYGDIKEKEDKCCTNKLKIIREIPWSEVLQIVNIGKDCTGFKNTGDDNPGDFNTGYRNTGNKNTGNDNTGNNNTGFRNQGNYNTGDYNYGNGNTDNKNIGDYNTGRFNLGDFNTGNFNLGSYNSGDWNTTSYSNGCFNTKGNTIIMFNKPSNWTYSDWSTSDACYLLNNMPKVMIRIAFSNMTEQERKYNPDAEFIGETLRIIDQEELQVLRQNWWKNLSQDQQTIIKYLPNFDKEIFKQITFIDVDQTD